MIERFLRKVLDAIEQRESRLLVWGLTDGLLTREELDELIDPVLDQSLDEGLTGIVDVDDVLDALRDRGLLFVKTNSHLSGYRSRMAETIRLLFRLRQLFPQHIPPDGWQQARTLVADYRFSWRRRRYPRRETSIDQIRGRVDEVVEDANIGKALSALLAGRGESFKLADFQMRATTRILENLEVKRNAGTLVSAGTGSGKTLAFYLPAMARIGVHLARDSRSSCWVKVLAIYPRTELLRDQFSEIYGEARRLDKFIEAQGGRKVRIGALFGATPQDGLELQRWPKKGWRRVETGYICGYMVCPVGGCGGDLIWPMEDLHQKRETLVCHSCGNIIADDEVVLTRAGMQRSPPDILFTTTEMLNQRLSDSRCRYLFGLRPGAVRPPEMVLLDEVHTYSSTHGAQVGYLLRRWRHLVRAPISFVGLSATLREGSHFFSRLTGLSEYQVAEVSPLRTEMTDEGAEYLLALRGDPVSRATLLATTIQAAMLLSRMLDTQEHEPSHGVYGHRIFAFTDDIDVTNRLYFSLLDAEGRNDRGEPNLARHPDGGLAVLRLPMPSESRERYGQNWSVPQAIGHRLVDRKRIGRTSSQDPGVAAGMDVIVATSSLEVGFNDPGVGAVIQHKAPRDSAPFLQRKGRAGRPRGMRPWTMVVLSDYGRDRLAYRNYEKLFDPELDVRYLPFSSRYIQRMQGVYALIDYLSVKIVGNTPHGSVWRDLARPEASQKRRSVLVIELRRLLEEPGAADDLQEYLELSLGLSRRDATALLWEYPRPLLTTVVPTALRRVATNWRCGGLPETDFQVRNSPLPEFAPSTLFSDLNLPEVRINIPPAWNGDRPEPQMMPIVQALRTFAPGRVSRRFGIERASIRHWVIRDLPNTGQEELEVRGLFDTFDLGTWDFRNGDQVESVRVFRPVEVNPIHPPRSVGDTSNAQLEWRTQFLTSYRGLIQSPPAGSAWCDLIGLVEGFSHAEHTPVEVRRFATGSDADIQFQGDNSQRTHFTFTNDGEATALGFSMSVDALRFRLEIPQMLWNSIDNSGSTARALRTKRYFDLAWSGERLALVENPFAREWLAVIYFAALSYDALIRKVNLSDADVALAAGAGSIDLNQIMDTLFQSPAIPNEGGAGSGGQDRLRQELDGLLGRNDIRQELRNLSTVLWEPIDVSWELWLRERFTATTAAAAFEAIQNLCPEIDAEGLVVDIDAGPRASNDALTDDANCAEFWVSESTPGGSGSIEAFLRDYSEEPRRFYMLMTAALQPNEYELIDHQLGTLLDHLAGPNPRPDLKSAVHIFRSAEGTAQAEEAFAAFRLCLSEYEFVLFHGFMSALSSRILRLGATADSDDFLLQAWSLWRSEESRLGVELDARTLAYRLSQEDTIDRVMASAGFPIPQDNLLAWRFNTIYGLLWGRGGDVRRATLNIYNPFCSVPDPERLLVAYFLCQDTDRLSLEEPNWQRQALETLGQKGRITLVCQLINKTQLAAALRFFATNPVELDYLSVFSRIDSLRRVDDVFEADLEIEEVLQ